MSEASSSAARQAPTESSGVRLFAASARNLVPRLIANGATAGVGLMFFGWLWTGLWFAACWVIVFAGMALMRQIQAAGETRRAVVLNRVLTGVNILSGSIACIMPVALWFAGHELGRAYALVTLFIGSAYVLLQYYANIRTFLTLITPYVAAYAIVCGEQLVHKGFTPVAVAILIASVLTLVNFFYLSQKTLEASRSALRRARGQAREGERGRGRQRGEERVPGHHEPRNPHPPQRGARHGAGDGGRDPVARAARAAGHHRPVGQGAPGDPQRHSRSLEDRGRQAGARGDRVRLGRSGPRRPFGLHRARQQAGALVRARHRPRPRRLHGRPDAPSADPLQPHLQRTEIHRARRDPRHRGPRRD